MSTVRILKSLIMALPCLTLLAACSRGGVGGTSRIVIQSPQNFGKLGSLSVPANRKACWGANITGAGLSGPGGSQCSPATGVVAGYKASGEEISAVVAKGSNRKIDLYLYLLPENNNGACPTIGAVIPPGQLINTFLVGSATADFVNDTTVVEITAVFPGLANNLAVTSSMPATCTAGAGPSGNPVGFSVGSTFVEATAGDGSKLIGRASGTFGQKVLTDASGNKLIVK